ncbi:hypothetical protein L1987_37265 [Smallanthus sonchifolius]|uniref:Uncharacterized protein n=1 Tax=Smallanthus sonchifolius TaxID=185202 RepID=A0ACB9HFU5_9ASTR|nr:hypothetical protein L1987_37265 [Smallanthus sonchifolius]
MECSCGIGRVGNPYLRNQCEESEDCRTCQDSGGTCQYEQTYDFNGTWRLNCQPTVYYTQIFRSSKTPPRLILGKLLSLFAICIAYILGAMFNYFSSNFIL